MFKLLLFCEVLVGLLIREDLISKWNRIEYNLMELKQINFTRNYSRDLLMYAFFSIR